MEPDYVPGWFVFICVWCTWVVVGTTTYRVNCSAQVTSTCTCSRCSVVTLSKICELKTYVEYTCLSSVLPGPSSWPNVFSLGEYQREVLTVNQKLVYCYYSSNCKGIKTDNLGKKTKYLWFYRDFERRILVGEFWKFKK